MQSRSSLKAKCFAFLKISFRIYIYNRYFHILLNKIFKKRNPFIFASQAFFFIFAFFNEYNLRAPSPNELATLKSERVLSSSFIANRAGISLLVLRKENACGFLRSIKFDPETRWTSDKSNAIRLQKGPSTV